MKKLVVTAAFIGISAFTFAQDKEIKKAQKAIKKGDFTEAMQYVNEAESLIAGADNDTKTEFYLAKAETILGTAGNDSAKLQNAADAFMMAQKSNVENKMAAEMDLVGQKTRAGLVNSAIVDQNAQNYKDAATKLYTSYMVSKKDTSDLYFAAGNAVNAKDYKTAIDYYKTLYDVGYTGSTKEFVATNKETGEVEKFDSKDQRDIMVKTGEFIKPEARNAESKRGEILRNMTLIYIEQGDNEKATSLMADARKENPKDMGLLRADADMAYKLGNLDKYNKLMEEVVASDPENSELYYNLGVGSAGIGMKDKAMGYYKKALELNPTYTSAQINIAALMLAAEKDLVDKMNALGTSSADNKKYEEYKKEREQLYRDAIPYLESAIQSKPDNLQVAKTLANIYSQIGEDAKAKEMKAKVTELEGKQ